MIANRIARATPETPTAYTVTYDGRSAADFGVGYDYLRQLARDGWTVHVGGVAFTPAHTIRPEAAEPQ